MTQIVSINDSVTGGCWPQTVKLSLTVSLPQFVSYSGLFLCAFVVVVGAFLGGRGRVWGGGGVGVGLRQRHFLSQEVTLCVSYSDILSKTMTLFVSDGEFLFRNRLSLSKTGTTTFPVRHEIR